MNKILLIAMFAMLGCQIPQRKGGESLVYYQRDGSVKDIIIKEREGSYFYIGFFEDGKIANHGFFSSLKKDVVTTSILTQDTLTGEIIQKLYTDSAYCDNIGQWFYYNQKGGLDSIRRY